MLRAVVLNGSKFAPSEQTGIKMIRIIIVISFWLCALMAAANSETTDSVKSRNLDEVVVEAQLQRTSATVSTYLPTKRQKNAAQTGPELLNHMAIPQLGIVSGNSVTTNSGQKVDLYIDFVPATEQDLAGMRMADVKKVEYYDFPQDPRFQGSEHVVNFIMQKYEYGGYVKAYANEFFISNSGQLNLYSKFQYKRMTYDLAVGGWYSSNDHLSQQTVETYRLPQPDGSLKIFERLSDPVDSRVRQHSYWPTFKATYATDKVTMVNTIGANFFRSPKEYSAGTVSYTGNPDVSPYKSYDLSLRYVYMPDNRFNFAAFANNGLITDRYAYVYMASPDGVLRTIRQKGVGNFYSLLYGVQGTARLLGNSLMINGQVAHRIVRNGAPFDWTRQRVVWYLQAFYYVGDWNFGLQYQSPQEYCDGYVNGAWIKNKSAYTAIVGWGNSSWSLQARLTNPFRWNWNAGSSETTSQSYDVSKTFYNVSYHCYVPCLGHLYVRLRQENTARQRSVAADGNLVGHPAITGRCQNSNSSRVRVVTFSISGTRRLKWADDM